MHNTHTLITFQAKQGFAILHIWHIQNNDSIHLELCLWLLVEFRPNKIFPFVLH